MTMTTFEKATHNNGSENGSDTLQPNALVRNAAEVISSRWGELKPLLKRQTVPDNGVLILTPTLMFDCDDLYPIRGEVFRKHIQKLFVLDHDAPPLGVLIFRHFWTMLDLYGGCKLATYRPRVHDRRVGVYDGHSDAVVFDVCVKLRIPPGGHLRPAYIYEPDGDFSIRTPFGLEPVG